MRKTLLVIAVAALYVLHQDVWFWRTPRVFGVIPLGFVPVGLFYHACFSAAAAGLMWLLVTYAWPSHLEEEVERRQHAQKEGP